MCESTYCNDGRKGLAFEKKQTATTEVSISESFQKNKSFLCGVKKYFLS